MKTVNAYAKSILGYPKIDSRLIDTRHEIHTPFQSIAY